ncbi:porin family protein [Hymenobacter negativus]|uniref:PorT family protein n=1 Tax=Hymenobacter negativus TaxID=2795026 RepID=A0ABS0Q5W7_9BACT|nr:MULTISPECIES: porin family protein [Bacteria]MBH8558038.1 PorT family protein [Hymenobacter negativus]MBH8568528.1 PorT family protein [Hymenobacter negativus]MBR7208262.1 PorT family protein [Microvirga sp. STS02]
MKKTLLLLLLAITSASSAFAQAAPGGALSSKDYTGGKTTDSRNTGFGVKGGYNLNGLRGDDVKGIDRNSHSDFHAGVYGQFGFDDFSSVQVELLYSRLGFTANTGAGKAQQTYRTTYIQLPIMYVGNFTDNLSFHVGPQASLLINATKDGSTLGLADNGFNTFDFGGVGGLEARIGPARVGARYNLSLGKLFEDNIPTGKAIDPAFGNAKIYNNLLQVYVGIGFTQ